jgi:hypothetical protein
VKPVALYYLGLLDDIRAAARGCGYAIGLHGSLQRDFDLIACPWREDATSAKELVRAVTFVVGGAVRLEESREKPHGRRAWLIYLPATGFEVSAVIDLSVMPRMECEK